MAPAMGNHVIQRVKELFLTAPLHNTLMACINPIEQNNPRNNIQKNTDIILYTNLAKDILAYAIQM
jgi:hypothetical protein